VIEGFEVETGCDKAVAGVLDIGTFIKISKSDLTGREKLFF